MKNNFSQICERLWDLRERSGLTDTQVIALSGKSNGFWHRLKHSSHDPYRSTLQQIADRMLVNVEYLIEGKNPPNWEEWKKRINAVVAEPDKVKDGGPTRITNAESVIGTARRLAIQLGVSEDEIIERVVDVLKNRRTGK